jgi:secreted trypsin-like serine protease
MRRPALLAACACAVLGSGPVLPAVASAGSVAPRIVGGGKAYPAGWEFTVALEQKRHLTCGGSLVAPAKVLTAAHCVKGGKRKNLAVLAGSPWISGPQKPARTKVTAVSLDPDYNGKKVERDFAVLTLASPQTGPAIQLATMEESAAATAPGQILRSAGWGSRSAWGFRLAQRLKSTRERVYPARKCQRAYTKSQFQGRSMICTLGKRVRRTHSRLPFHATSCEGDSGGPLVADTPAGPRLVGVVSAGVFPCGLGGASIYARVANQLPFILAAIGS